MRALTPRRWIILGCIALAGIALTGAFATVADEDWTLGDWYSSVVGLAVFVIGVTLSFGQGDLQRDQHELQRALGDLELREKITCFYAHGAELERSPETVERAFGLIGDARSALPVFGHARNTLQREFLQALALNLTFVRDIDEQLVAHRLADLAGRLADELESAACPDDCRDEQAAAVRALAHLASL